MLDQEKSLIHKKVLEEPELEIKEHLEGKRVIKRNFNNRIGGHAHGHKPKDFSFHMAKKIRLLALKTMLSAKLAEGKIRIIDSEQVELPKTKVVAKIME